MTSVRAIDLAALRSAGIRALLLDMDNTVSPHHSAVIVPEIREWLARLPEAGFKVRFISNNWHSTIHERAAALGFDVVAKAMKPLPFGFQTAARELEVSLRECAVVGDQVFTDVLGGNLVGATTVLVQPLSSVDLPHTLLLRHIERVIMGSRTPQA